MSTTKLPTDTRSLVRDPDLAAALEQELQPYAGKQLEKAQAAIRQARMSGMHGTFDQILAAYRAAILKAVSEKGEK